MINTTSSVVMMMLLMVAAALLLQKVKLIKNYMGPALTVIIMGIFLSNTGVMPFYQDAYGAIMQYSVPISIAIMLLSVDLRELFTLSKKALLAMVIAVCSVAFVTMIAGFFIAGGLDEGWKIAGMFIGTYTGGSSNLSAIAVALDATPLSLASANAADYVIGMPLLVLLFALPPIFNNSKHIHKLWPYSLTQEQLEVGSEEKQLMERKEWGITDIAVMLAYGFAVTEIATAISTLFPESYASAIRILAVTTIALIAAQTPFARKLKGNMDLGMYVSLLFLCVIGLSVSFAAFAGSALAVTVFCFIVILGSLVLHIVICRICKIEYQYVLVSITASIGDSSTAALVAAGGGWKALISIGVVLGVVGNVLGNYLGIATAYMLKYILGM